MLNKLGLLVLAALSLTAADEAWKNKQFPEWTEDDAKELLKDSPWVKTVAATLVKPSAKEVQVSGPFGRHGGKGRGASDTAAAAGAKPPMLTLRWESALPVREAELKARDVTAPTLDDEDHYAIAVYGIPRGMLKDDSKVMAENLKRQAVLKREGQARHQAVERRNPAARRRAGGFVSVPEISGIRLARSQNRFRRPNPRLEIHAGVFVRRYDFPRQA